MSNSRHYYEAFGEVRRKLVQLLSEHRKAAKEVQKYAKSIGATGYVTNDAFGNCLVRGFVFASPPDPSLWKKRDGRDCTYYAPRLTTKFGKELNRTMMAFRLGGGKAIADIIGISIWKGAGYHTPGCEMLGKRVFVIVPKGASPAGLKRDALKECRRISDLAFERTVAKFGRERAAKKAAAKKTAAKE